MRSFLVKFTRRVRHATSFAVAALAVVLADGAGGSAYAQGRLDARYTITLAGVTVGRGSWVIDIADDHFTSAASGQTAGLLRVFSGGRGQSAVRGTIVGGQLVPAVYTSSIYTDNNRYDEVRMTLTAGGVEKFVAEPAAWPAPNRVPLTEAHRRGVADPMSAALFHVPGTGSLFTPEACPRKLAIFDGRMRYDLHLTFKRIDSVKAANGYQGHAVVCSVIFSPIAGHVPDRAPIRYLANLREIEVWLAPIAGTRVLAPYRFTVPTPLGLGTMQATQFVTTPGKSAKVQ